MKLSVFIRQCEQGWEVFSGYKDKWHVIPNASTEQEAREFVLKALKGPWPIQVTVQ